MEVREGKGNEKRNNPKEQGDKLQSVIAGPTSVLKRVHRHL